MPGANARALEKARSLDADVLLLDLEDAVAPEAKAEARANVVAAVQQRAYGRREVVIRINALTTPWGRDDLQAAAAALPDAILLPKVSSPEVVQAAAEVLRAVAAPPALRLWAMIETPQALFRLDSIAALHRDPAARLDAFVLGTNDLAKETGARLLPGRAPMMAWLSLAVAAARAHGVTILDGVHNDIADRAGFERECAQGRDFGMDGKTLIHPDQIAPCNQIFSPDAAEIARARKIVEAFDLPENKSRGAIRLDGRMVELLHADMARKTLAIVDAIAAKAQSQVETHQG
ncbi:MAG: CoA ester lyase [Hyphomicrobiales bacterium]|nr:CoA ester lyase [Hyphomicrobiales bacterium]